MTDNVVIVDDFPVFVIGLVGILGSEGFEVVVAAATNDIATSPPPNIFIIGAALAHGPTRPSTATLELLGTASRMAPVLLLAAGPCADMVSRYLRAGASGVVERCAPPGMIVEGVRAVAAGGRFIKAVLARPPRAAAGAERYGWQGFGGLSKREREVLEGIVIGMTQAQIARAIGISQHTVDTYIRRMKSKLNAASVADLTRLAVQEGIGRTAEVDGFGAAR